ncbi:MAG: hypothetical protein Q7J64_02835 [Elusimicrobiota bacterium]|nr:hypothetical protein [Elusimicrobiota bacterium]
MKKITLFVLACLAALAVPVRAQKSGSFGAGVVLGAPTGATGKLWLDATQAIDAGLGWNDALTVYGDYLWHGWTLLPQPPQGRMPVYLGLGAQVRAYNDSEFSLRAVAGIAYWLPNDPIEIFAELVPLLHLTRQTGAGFDGAAGVRYYFN